MSQQDPSNDSGFIGENPNWGITALAGFAIVAVVLASIILGLS